MLVPGDGMDGRDDLDDGKHTCAQKSPPQDSCEGPKQPLTTRGQDVDEICQVEQIYKVHFNGRISKQAECRGKRGGGGGQTEEASDSSEDDTGQPQVPEGVCQSTADEGFDLGDNPSESGGLHANIRS